jgi:hypothetical protein
MKFIRTVKRYAVTIGVEAGGGTEETGGGKMSNVIGILEQKVTERTEGFSPASVISVCSCSIFSLLLFFSSAFAHEVRPAYLELRETEPETYAALWKVPGQGENLRLGLYVELPVGATNVTAPRASMANNAFTERWTVKREAD